MAGIAVGLAEGVEEGPGILRPIGRERMPDAGVERTLDVRHGAILIGMAGHDRRAGGHWRHSGAAMVQGLEQF